MRDVKRQFAFWLCAPLVLWATACGGGSPQNTQQAKTTPTVTVTPNPSSVTTAQAVTVTAALSGSPAPTGSVVLTSGGYTSAATSLSGGGASINIPAGSLSVGTDNLTVSYTPDAASSTNYNSATGSASVAVTAPAKTTPTVTVTPNPSSVTTAQAVTVTVALSGSPAPTGSVVLTSGVYTSAATSLSGGGASINIPAGSLSVGTDNLTVSYTPDAASASTYNSATGSASVVVTAPAKTTPTVTVTPTPSSVTTAQAVTVTVALSGSPAPTGSVVLTSGSYTSAATSLSGGGASINIPAGSLSVGTDNLTVSYTPDAASSTNYNSAIGSSSVTVTAAAPMTYQLTINSIAPSSGVAITVSPADNNGASSGSTSFTRTYNAGSAVTLTAPTTSGSYSFVSWTGCTTNPKAGVCDVTLNANTTVTANYNQVTITSITVSPNTATIGKQVQFAASVAGTGSYSTAVSWAVTAPSGSALSPGTIVSTSGLYTTPYPAPATVTVTATSTQDATKSGSVTVTLSQPAAAAGPALTVDAGNQTHAISPYIYGMNGYPGGQSAAAASISQPIDRWGGNEATSYNYLYDLDAKGSDWYFENYIQNSNPINTPSGSPETSTFNTQVMNDAAIGATTLGTVPIIGWVPADNANCSFSIKKYGAQTAAAPDRTDCGNGVNIEGVNGCTNPSGCNVVNDPTDTYYQVTPATFDATWVSFLVKKFGTAATGGVAIYELDNEPSWWMPCTLMCILWLLPTTN